MPLTTVDDVLQRARSASGRPTLYWLGEGGRDPQALGPTTRLAVAPAWQTLTPAQQRELEPIAVAAGIDVHDPHLFKDACDCSGFVCWVLGLARKTTPSPFTDGGGWIFTDSIWADATGPGVKFQRLDAARPGALVVYPKEGSQQSHGHVAIVVEADAAGRATRVSHCSAANVMTPPFDAIKITSPEAFERQPRSVYAWCRDVVA